MSALVISSKKKTTPTTRIPKMPMIEQAGTNRFAKCLIFGPSGQGKTYLLGTAQNDPRTYPMVLIDYEGGTSTLVGWSPEIDIIKVRTWADFDDAWAMLKGKHPYNSLAIDSISESHIFALLAQLDSGVRTRTIPDLLEQGDYGIALVQMRKMLRKFRDLPMHVFTSCMDRTEDDPREGRVKKPALAGALADEAPGIFEMVAYLALSDIQVGDEIETHRYLLLKNQSKIRTKVRMPFGVEAPDYLEDPTITSILDMLRITAVPQASRFDQPEEPEELEVDDTPLEQKVAEEDTQASVEEEKEEPELEPKPKKTMTISTRKSKPA